LEGMTFERDQKNRVACVKEETEAKIQGDKKKNGTSLLREVGEKWGRGERGGMSSATRLAFPAWED